jgi:hypothetical protein
VYFLECSTSGRATNISELGINLSFISSCSLIP